MATETSATCPLTVTDGTFAGQVAISFYPPLLQRLMIALPAVAEQIIVTESPSDTNYADRALYARTIAGNPNYYANSLAPLIAADTEVTATCTDQTLLNRIWTIIPVVSYKYSTLATPSTTPGT